MKYELQWMCNITNLITKSIIFGYKPRFIEANIVIAKNTNNSKFFIKL